MAALTAANAKRDADAAKRARADARHAAPAAVPAHASPEQWLRYRYLLLLKERQEKLYKAIEQKLCLKCAEYKAQAAREEEKQGEEGKVGEERKEEEEGKEEEEERKEEKEGKEVEEGKEEEVRMEVEGGQEEEKEEGEEVKREEGAGQERLAGVVERDVADFDDMFQLTQ